MLAEISLGMRSLLFPARCAGCRGEALENPDERPLCEECWRRLPWAEPARLPRSSPLDGAVSVWAYEGPARELVQALKYRGMLWLVPFLGRELARAARRLPGGETADAVTAVPLHPTRLRERTFNQADALARCLAQELGLPCRLGLLRRRLPTHAQPGLSRKERFRNVRGAFQAAEAPASPAPAHVLLVDDVLTTGATAETCALALKAAGVARVTVVTLARG